MLFRCTYLLALLGCQAKPEAPPPAGVVVRDGTGAVIAQLRPGHPCRTSIGPVELLVGGPPLVAQLGDVRWSGETAAAGTTFLRDGERVARVFPVDDPDTATVIDPQGVTLARVAVAQGGTTVSDAAGRVVRHLARHGDAISVDAPALVVTGTPDVVLAALLSAPELAPEVRMLAACERTLRGS